MGVITHINATGMHQEHENTKAIKPIILFPRAVTNPPQQVIQPH